MKRVTPDHLQALAAEHGTDIERDPDTDLIYTKIGRVEYVAQLDRSAVEK